MHHKNLVIIIIIIIKLVPEGDKQLKGLVLASHRFYPATSCNQFNFRFGNTLCKSVLSVTGNFKDATRILYNSDI